MPNTRGAGKAKKKKVNEKAVSDVDMENINGNHSATPDSRKTILRSGKAKNSKKKS